MPYAYGAPDDTPPLVTDVNARLDVGARFVLGLGRFVYKFHVESGGGKFSVSLDDVDAAKTVGQDDYDTANGSYALTLVFEVK